MLAFVSAVSSPLTSYSLRVRNKDRPWFNDDCRRACDLKQEAQLQWTHDSSRFNWDEFDHYQRRTNVVYAEAGRQFSVRSSDVLINAQYPLKWWSTLKSAVFGPLSDSSYPPFIWGGEGASGL